MITAAIYVRVSTDEQTHGTSLDSQRQLCTQYAERQGYRLGPIYADEGVSGRTADRPALQQLLSDARMRRFQTVLVYKIDRFARSTRLALESMEALEKTGVRVESITESLDRGSAAGNFNTTVMLGAAQLYSDMLAERMRTALTHKAQQGRWVGPAPYGCQVRDNVLTGNDQLILVALIFQRYAAGGDSYASLADWLNSQGHRTREGKPFGRESIRTILRSAAYSGVVTSGGTAYQGQHGELFPNAAALYTACGQLRKEREHGTTNNGKHLAESPSWLTGLVYCEHCGGRLWHHFGGRDGSLRYYMCSGRSARICTVRQVQANRVEAAMLDLFGALFIPDAILPTVLDLLRARRASADASPRAIEPAGIQAKLKRLALVYADGAIDEATYRRERDSLRAMLAEAEQQVGVAPRSFDERAALNALAAVGILVAEANTMQRRRLARALVSRIWVLNGEIYALSPRAEIYPILASWAQVAEEKSNGVSGGVPDGLSSPGVIPNTCIWLTSPDRVKIAA